MKTFLNVLYRRILYKIPLKLLLILLVLFGLFFLGFSKADYLDGLEYITTINNTNGNLFSRSFGDLGLPNSQGLVCFKINSFGGNNRIVVSYVTQNNIRYLSEYSFSLTLFGCYNYQKSLISDFIVGNENGDGINFNMDIYFLKSDFDIIDGDPGYTSLQCQTEYNLIPISSVDQNYCTTNNLCPSQDCPVCPVGTGNLTQLYINNILHVGAPTILMNIPDEIDWDYVYTMGGNTMNIDIVGYNVDYDKINEQINLQNFKPSSEDLSQVVSGIIPLFVPGLCIILLLYFIFRFIKKIF